MAYPNCKECGSPMLYYGSSTNNEEGIASLSHSYFCPKCKPELFERYKEVNGGVE